MEIIGYVTFYMSAYEKQNIKSQSNHGENIFS